jgi:hypothetical protein
MTVAEAPRLQSRREPNHNHPPEVISAPWSRADSVWAVVWLLTAMATRLPLIAHVEGVLDHDQAVVGLMALDISQGRRWPIFFDGQRYMGALEAYIAAIFVALFGHEPAIVALVPALFFALFAMGQYIIWRLWADRTTAHLAALITVLGAPMLAVWSFIPRGGYSEVLAWALPVLAIYRQVTRPNRAPLSAWAQFGWGALLAFGYFLNPLSLIVYATLLIDWTFGRHGADLRRQRHLDGRWPDSWSGTWFGLGMGGLFVVVLAIGCHVHISPNSTRSRFLFVLDLLPSSWGVPVGALIVLSAVAWAAWWTGAAVRITRLLLAYFGFTMGMLVALSPFLIYNLRVRLGWAPRELSLPIWIRAPWSLGPNLVFLLHALRPLIGCDAHAATSLMGQQFAELPPLPWTPTARWLAAMAPLVIFVTALVVGRVIVRDREAWRMFGALRLDRPTPPTLLCTLGLLAAFGLYLLQASSANASSIRYLLPVWIFLPGLLASGSRALSVPKRFRAGLLLLVPWTCALIHFWASIDRPSPFRALVCALESRGTSAIIAPTHVVLQVANFTHNRVGGLEFHSSWPRVRHRFADRFPPGQPLICVDDLGCDWTADENLSRRLEELARRYPGRVRLLDRVGAYPIWEVDRPMAEILAPEEPPLSRSP